MEKKPRPPSADADQSGSSILVLVVDDYEPFRRFVCSTLGHRPDLLVIGEASDGLEAVQKAEELQPDLILLDLGLPTLNGIAAARQIRKLVPEAKIIFLTQESSPDIAQEALSSGALGYVVKAHGGSELLAAVEAVCQGMQFVSSGLGALGVPITYRIDVNERLIHTKCVGLVKLDEVIHHLQELERDPVCPDHLDVFLDLCELGSLPESGELGSMINAIALFRDKIEFGVCAIVASRDALFDMMIGFEELGQQYFREMRVFRIATEAEKWLRLRRLAGQ
ncbi:MAG: response regulator transcription factor [Candidatus Acidiferrum sp.]|jgi:CheY-like chemotaxis protein